MIDHRRSCPHRQFHTLPSLLDSQAALSTSGMHYLRSADIVQRDACMPSREAVCTIFMWAGTRTHDLLHEKRTRLLLSHPDVVPTIRTPASHRHFCNVNSDIEQTKDNHDLKEVDIYT